jgi:glycerate 2-kinase
MSYLDRLTTQTLRTSPWGASVTRILAAALQAVEPGAAVRSQLQRSGDRLEVGDQAYDLSHFRRLLLVGAGKAGAPMAQAVVQILGERLAAGIVVVKEGYAGVHIPHVQILEAGHPLPDERGVQAAGHIIQLLSDTDDHGLSQGSSATPVVGRSREISDSLGSNQDDLVICVLSGGGSALLVAPASGISLSDLQGLTAALLTCGASINEINCLRKHLEQLKGGSLARLVSPARLLTLILSDVVGDPLEVIASGPTVPDPSTFADAFHVLERYALLPHVPAPIVAHLQRGLRGEIPETPKPGNPLFDNVQNVIVGNNLQAAQVALEQAQAEGFHTLLLTTCLQGEARQAGHFLASIARLIDATGQPVSRPACIIAGGETTVTVAGDGLGGRNQELALGAVSDLAGLPDIALVTLATDGGDGPTDAAGAVVTGQSLARALRLGLRPADYLARNDAYHFFSPLGDLLQPGPTQTNVNDLSFIFAF